MATHTGLVRSANEDDFLLLAPPERRPVMLLAAIADGMGGVAGGAEASRTGLRGLAGGVLQQAGADARSALARGYDVACARVHEQAQLVPALRDMGTTLTALLLDQDRAVLGHVGDTRAYLLRGGQLKQLTTDHASRQQQNRLLRCIGGGQEREDPDVVELELHTGDRFLLCTDGVWGTVESAELADLLGRHAPSAAAERMVAAAIAAGGPDNGTAVIVHVVDSEPGAEDQEVVLPTEEASRRVDLERRGRLGAPRWPWLLVAATVVLVAATAAHWFTGVDAWQWLLSLGR